MRPESTSISQDYAQSYRPLHLMNAGVRGWPKTWTRERRRSGRVRVYSREEIARYEKEASECPRESTIG